MKLFLLQLGSELRKLFARKRTYIGFAAFLVVETIVLLLMQLPSVRLGLRNLVNANGYGFDQYDSALTLAYLILTSTIFLLTSLYLALVAGDVVAKEVEEGTMRMMLCRPISRVRILLLKYLACLIYTFVLILFLGVSALAVGFLRRGAGGMFIFDPFENLFALYDFGPGLARYAAVLPLFAFGLSSVTSFAFMLSCCNMKPAAATIITLSYFFLDSIFRGLPYFKSIRVWLITTHLASWTNIFREHIPVWQMVQDYAYLIGVDATLVVVGMVIFVGRDLKS